MVTPMMIALTMLALTMISLAKPYDSNWFRRFQTG